MIWRMGNLARFQESIDFSGSIRIIIDVVRRSAQNSKLSIQNTVVDLRVLKVFGITTRPGKPI